jgi:phosphohistidine phosphatase
MKQLKVLHVVRHAKSAWDDDGVADIDRPLKSRGIKNAYEISRRLKLSDLVPQKIISSPADRALHTAVIFARVFDYPMTELEISSVLYATSTEKILDLIRNLSDTYQSIMIFGHNPDSTDLVNHFIKSPVDNIPTAGVATLKFNSASWKEIHRRNLDQHIFNFPNKEE